MSDTVPRSALEAADNLVAALVEPAAFWRVFKSVKFETVDTQDGAGGGRVIVVVAKGEAADLISAAYDDAVKDLPGGEPDAVT
jgi:hypothetical protein